MQARAPGAGETLPRVRPVALVTGASRRLGRAFAEGIALAGYDVAVHFRSDPAAAAERFMRRLIGEARWDALPERTRATRRAEGVALVGELSDLRAHAPWLPGAVTVPVWGGVGEAGRWGGGGRGGGWERAGTGYSWI